MTCEERGKVYELYVRVINTMWRLQRAAPGTAVYERAFEAYEAAHTAFGNYVKNGESGERPNLRHSPGVEDIDRSQPMI